VARREQGEVGEDWGGALQEEERVQGEAEV
jgi:hypothetical protein